MKILKIVRIFTKMRSVETFQLLLEIILIIFNLLISTMSLSLSSKMNETKILTTTDILRRNSFSKTEMFQFLNRNNIKRFYFRSKVKALTVSAYLDNFDVRSSYRNEKIANEIRKDARKTRMSPQFCIFFRKNSRSGVQDELGFESAVVTLPVLQRLSIMKLSITSF